MSKYRDRQRHNRRVKENMQNLEKTNASKISDPTAYRAMKDTLKSDFIKPNHRSN